MLSVSPSYAQNRDQAGDFDYYVLALSWSPTWCAFSNNTDYSKEQCDRPLGWVLHGLWPQYEQGYPSNCSSIVKDPSRQMTAAMADIMGTKGAAWYQWKKHGRCTGLSALAYFETARTAFNSVTKPDIFRKLPNDIQVPASVIEEAFLADNPHLSNDGFTVSCRQNHIQEVRICLNKDLSPRSCAPDIQRGCTLEDAHFLTIN